MKKSTFLNVLALFILIFSLWLTTIYAGDQRNDSSGNMLKRQVLKSDNTIKREKKISFQDMDEHRHSMMQMIRSLPQDEQTRSWEYYYYEKISQSEAELLFVSAQAAIYVLDHSEVFLLTNQELKSGMDQYLSANNFQKTIFNQKETFIGERSLVDFVGDLETLFPDLAGGMQEKFIVKIPCMKKGPEGVSISPTKKHYEKTPSPIVLYEGFEDPPWGNWQRINNSDDNYMWEVTTCDSNSGSYSADGVRGGYIGADLRCDSEYPINLNNWMLYDFCLELEGASEAWLDSYISCQTEFGYDWVMTLFKEPLGETYWGWGYYGNWGEGWFHQIVNLRQFSRLGDLTDYPCNRLAFVFTSDSSIAGGFGARVDDITVQRDSNPGMTCSISGPTTAIVGVPVQFYGNTSGISQSVIYEWRFDDETFYYELNPIHTFDSEGEHRATFLVYNDWIYCHSHLNVLVGPGEAGSVPIWYDEEHTGSIYRESASQVVPATYLTFQINPDSFPAASPFFPVIIEIQLPPGAVLSQTLATGTVDTASPLPQAGEILPGLAVTEYFVTKATGTPEAISTGKILEEVGPHAVQLFRYVAGEDRIWIRINESTSHWTVGDADFLGFTIGLGAGVWPDTELSNWGPDGYHQQASTLFYMDLRNYDFLGNEDTLNVMFDSFYQRSETSNGADFIPGILTLFYVDEYLEDAPATSQIGSVIEDFTVVDLNRDSIEDIVTIDSGLNRLYWAFGQPNGAFDGLDWREPICDNARTVDAADISGDSRPDILISDAAGTLWIYLWEDLFGGDARLTKIASPSCALKMPGQPSDSLLRDVNNDGFVDYLFSDISDNAMTVMLGNSFSASSSYAAGTSPSAITAGDFNGNGAVDAAVANRDANSVTVFYNDGTGDFTPSNLPNIGSQPVDISAADFDRNGKIDLAVALEGDKALAALLVQADDQFDPAQLQKIFFLNTPSAIQTSNFDALNGADVLMGYSDFNKLSLCTSDENGTLAFAYNIETLGDIVLDPFHNVTLSSDNIVSVGGGTGFGGVSSRAGVASITQQGFNILHFPRSSSISFSVANMAEDEALLNLELYDDDGLYRTGTTVSVPAKTQFARYFPDLLGEEANLPNRWVRGFLSQAETSGMWLISGGSTGLDYLDGTRIPDVRDALVEFVFPQIYHSTTKNNRYTSLMLVNPSQDDANVILTLYDGEGSQKESKTFLLKGRGRWVQDAGTFFSSLSETDSIFVQADRPIVGMEIFGDNKATACLEGIQTKGTYSILYSPHVAVGNLGVLYESFLTMINTSGADATLQITLFDDSGVQQGEIQTVDLAAQRKKILDIGVLFSISGAATGYLKVDTQGASGIVGCITFGDASQGEFLSCLPLQWEGHDDYILGHIANGTLGSITYFTGMAVLNPDDDDREVQISAYNQYGVLLDSQSMTINGHHRGIFLLDGLMPGLAAIFGGYILVDGPDEGELMVFILFGNAPFQFLSAVSAAPLE